MVQSTFVGIAALLVTLITASDDVKPIAEQRDAETTAATSFFPLGVYWPWETTGVVGQGSERVAKLEPFLIQRLDQLAAHHVNIVWTVNGPDSVAELELLCRLAEPRKICIIAGSGWWAMHPGNANDQWARVAVAHLQKICQELAGKPRPMAYTIADEPSGGHLAAFGRYAAAVKAAGIPATTTVMHGDIEAAADKAATLPWLSVDFYPFFGSTHGPRGDSSYAWFDRVVRRIVKATQQHEQTPWVMAQAYQEIWGPSRLEPDGQVTVLPGGGQHWLLPTPAQIRWQAWTAAALGTRGSSSSPMASRFSRILRPTRSRSPGPSKRRHPREGRHRWCPIPTSAQVRSYRPWAKSTRRSSRWPRNFSACAQPTKSNN